MNELNQIPVGQEKIADDQPGYKQTNHFATLSKPFYSKVKLKGSIQSIGYNPKLQ